MPKLTAIFINEEVNTEVWRWLCALTHANNTVKPSWGLLKEQRRQRTGEDWPAEKSKQAQGVAATFNVYCAPVASCADTTRPFHSDVRPQRSSWQKVNSLWGIFIASGQVAPSGENTAAKHDIFYVSSEQLRALSIISWTLLVITLSCHLC